MSSSKGSYRARRPLATPEDRLARLAVSYVARQARTSGQLGQYLSRKGASAEAIARVLRRFQDLGYINDRAFARRWAEARLRKLPMGAARLRLELLAKGVAEPDVHETLLEVYPRGAEQALAQRVVAGARRASSTKVLALLQNRGFGADVIEALIDTSGTNSSDSPGDDER